LAALEDGAHGGTRADFLADYEQAERGFIASGLEAETESRSRYRVGFAHFPVTQYLEPLAPCVDSKAQWIVDIFQGAVNHYALSLCPDNIELQSLAQLAPWVLKCFT
jgi:hypothetical protein